MRQEVLILGVNVCESVQGRMSCSQYVYQFVCECCEVTQSCLTLCDPMDCSLPGSSIHGIFQARIQEWVAISFSKGSSPPSQQVFVSAQAASGTFLCGQGLGVEQIGTDDFMWWLKRRSKFGPLKEPMGEIALRAGLWGLSGGANCLMQSLCQVKLRGTGIWASALLRSSVY